MMRHVPLAITLTLLGTACLDEPPPPRLRDASMDLGRDAGPPFTVDDVNAYSESGAARTLANAPRRPLFRVRLSNEPMNAVEAVFLMTGSADEELLRDVDTLPLRIDSMARVIASAVTVQGNEVTLRPNEALLANGSFVLVVARWLRAIDGSPLVGDARVYPVHVSESLDDGATLTDTWPAHGSSGVPCDIPLLALRFDGTVSGVEQGIQLVDIEGMRVPTSARVTQCEVLGYHGGYCVALTPLVVLAPNAPFSMKLTASLLDGTGAPLPMASARFTTAHDEDALALSFASAECAIDEAAAGLGCVRTDDTALFLRARASVPVRAWLSIGVLVDHVVSPRGELRLELSPLPPGASLVAQLRTVDLSGEVGLFDVPFTMSEPLATLAITEVRADPRGPEPQQEYVELFNYGDESVDLAGFSISDRTDALGDLIATSHRLAPHARALLVADTFDPNGPDDVPAPAGIALVRIGSSIATSGITNRGEALFLRDASMHRVSAAPALAVSQSGACIARVGESMRDGSTSSFHEAPCTPGAE